MSTQTTTDTTETVFFNPDIFVMPADGEKPYLLGYKCENENCGKHWFPRLDMCPDCWSNTKQVKLSRTGKLYSYSIIHVGSPGVPTPYVIGYIDMPEDLRVYSIIDIDPKKVKVGMELEVNQGIIKELDDGKLMSSYKFKPVE